MGSIQLATHSENWGHKRNVRVVLVKNSSGVPGAMDAHPPTAKSLVLHMCILHQQVLVLYMAILQWQSPRYYWCASTNVKECISNKEGARAKERTVTLDKTLRRKGGRRPVCSSKDFCVKQGWPKSKRIQGKALSGGTQSRKNKDWRRNDRKKPTVDIEGNSDQDEGKFWPASGPVWTGACPICIADQPSSPCSYFLPPRSWPDSWLVNGGIASSSAHISP